MTRLKTPNVILSAPSLMEVLIRDPWLLGLPEILAVAHIFEQAFLRIGFLGDEEVRDPLLQPPMVGVR